MKKFLSLVLAAMLLLSLMLPVLAEEDQLTYIYGGASNKNRAKLKTQGQQSWYMMYSLEIDKGAEIDLTTFKECTQTETGLWKPAESNVLPSSDPAAAEGTMVTYNADWFNIRKDGYLCGDTGFSAALKWVCEEDGVYDIFTSVSGGSSAGAPFEGYYDPNGGHWVPPVDGCYMSIWFKGEMVFGADTFDYVDSGYRLPTTETSYNGVEFKAGEEIWLVCDTKGNGGWDDPWFYLSLTRVGDLPQ